jgi:hypothetical protein
MMINANENSEQRSCNCTPLIKQPQCARQRSCNQPHSLNPGQSHHIMARAQQQTDSGAQVLMDNPPPRPGAPPQPLSIPPIARTAMHPT